MSRSFNLLLLIFSFSDATEMFGGENSSGTSKAKGNRKKEPRWTLIHNGGSESKPCVVEYIMTTCIFPYFPKRTKKVKKL